MEDDKTKLAMYVLDRALVLVLLFGLYQFATGTGQKWVGSQELLVAAIVDQSEEAKERWVSWHQNQEEEIVNQRDYIMQQKELALIMTSILNKMIENNGL